MCDGLRAPGIGRVAVSAYGSFCLPEALSHRIPGYLQSSFRVGITDTQNLADPKLTERKEKYWPQVGCPDSRFTGAFIGIRPGGLLGVFTDFGLGSLVPVAGLHCIRQEEQQYC